MNPKFCLKISGILKTFMPQFYEIPVLIYHSIGSPSKDSVPLELFKQHMQFFKENRYQVISIYKLIELIRERKKITLPSACITFDDGYGDSFSVAYPILKEYSFPATLFVIVNKIGQDGYLNFAQIRQMLNENLITIGSHTMNHPDILRLDGRELFYEIEESKKVLQDNLKYKIDLFAYPWGVFSPRIQTIVKQAGYKAAFSTNSRISREPQYKDLYALKRMTMITRDSFLRFLVKVSGFGACFSRKIKYEK